MVIAALYASVGFLISLLFSFIELWIPDALQYGYAGKDSVRWAVAALTVIFPIFVGASWLLERSFRAKPENRKYWVRTWLLWLTLVLAGAVLAGDAIAVLWSYLNGGLTGRFLLKVAVILVVAGSVFTYYFLDLFELKWKRFKKWIAWFAVGATIVAIAAGFYVAGSPAAERAARFDEQRVMDLQNIQWQIVNYWQAKQALPKTLDDLNDSINGFAAPHDPETSEVYGYIVKAAARSFELCASFNRATTDAPAKIWHPIAADGISENWAHGEGRMCFLRTIDPDRYPAIEKPPR